MKTLKVTLLIVTTFGCCLGHPAPPGYVIAAPPSSKKQEGVVLDKEKLGPNSAAPQDEDPIKGTPIDEEDALDHEYTLGELLRNKIGDHTLYQVHQEVAGEDEPQLIPVPIPKPILHSIDRRHNASGPVYIDPYEKLLESFVRGIMSRVLQAEIKEIRVEEMGRNKNMKASYE